MSQAKVIWERGHGLQTRAVGDQTRTPLTHF